MGGIDSRLWSSDSQKLSNINIQQIYKFYFDKCKKTTKTANEVSFEWPHQRNFTTDTKVRTTFQASIIYSKVFSVEGRLRNFKGWKIQLANTNQLTSFSLEHNYVARKYLWGSLRILFTSDQERILARQKSV